MTQGFAKADFADPAWQDWIPTWTNLTVGNGTVTARYIQIGSWVSVRVKVTFGSTSAMGNPPQISLPVVAAAYDTGKVSLGHAFFVNATPSADVLGEVVINTTTKAYLKVENAAGTYLEADNLASTVPFTWAVDDRIFLEFTYEAATSALIGMGLNNDHGALSGLTDDDHVAYFLADGTRSMTGQLLADDGTEAAPGIVDKDDLDTGIWFKGDADLAFVAGGSMGMRLGITRLRVPAMVNDTTVSAATVRVTSGGDGRMQVSTSSMKVKEDFQPLDNPLDVIRDLNPFNFRSKIDDRRYVGFGAEEVVAVIPDAYEVGNYDSRAIIAYLVAAVQDLSKQLEEMRDDNDDD